MVETSATVPAATGDPTPLLPAQQLAAALTEALHRHREAMIAGDTAAIDRWTDELAWLLPGMDAGVRQGVPVPASPPHENMSSGSPPLGLASAARELRKAVQMNLMLAQNGIVIAHQFAAAVAEASPLDDSALFAGVA
jgi:hypothetical protein